MTKWPVSHNYCEEKLHYTLHNNPFLWDSNLSFRPLRREKINYEWNMTRYTTVKQLKIKVGSRPSNSSKILKFWNEFKIQVKVRQKCRKKSAKKLENNGTAGARPVQGSMWCVDWKVIKYFRKQSCQLQSVAVWARERERESDNNLNTGRVIYFIAAQSCRDVGCEMFVEDLCFYVRLTPIILLYCYCFCPSYICPRSLFWGMMKTMPMSWHCPKQKNIPSRCTFISSAPGGRLKQSCYHGLTIIQYVSESCQYM